MPPDKQPGYSMSNCSDSSQPWPALRAMMPVAERWAYFDHAAVAPLPRGTHDAIEAWLADQMQNGAVNWSSWMRRLTSARGSAAKMLGASPEEVALVRNTTEGVTLVAEGFPWREGDNVVLPSCEFPSNRFPWMNLKLRGVEARIVPCDQGRIDPGAIDSACDARTRIVASSWVHYATGWRCDVAALAEVAHRHSALLFLDAIQGLGVLETDVSGWGVDFLAADGHKWLLGPEGAGVFYLRREHLDLLRPLGVGWQSADAAGDFSQSKMQLKETAARYEGGTHPMPGMVGLAASLELLQSHPSEERQARIIQITDLLCERLRQQGAEIVSDRSPEHQSGIVAFQLSGKDPKAVLRHCRERGVVLNSRDGLLRASPHLYTSEEDIQRLVESIESFDL